MTTSIANTKDGYIVMVFLRDSAGKGRWASLRNFGERQGDAKEFAEDVPKLSELVIKGMERTFDPKVKYRRIAFGRYARE